jgi:hypothetical protein
MNQIPTDAIQAIIQGRDDFEFFITTILNQPFYPAYNKWFEETKTMSCIMGEDRMSGRTTFCLYYTLYRLIYGHYQSIMFLTHNNQSCAAVVRAIYEIIKTMDPYIRDGCQFNIHNKAITTEVSKNQLICAIPTRAYLQGMLSNVLILDNAELYTDDQWINLHHYNVSYDKRVIITTR